MKNVIKIIKELRETSSTNDKLSILKREKGNELLQKVLLYTLDPFKKYGLSEKTLIPTTINNTYKIDIFNLLDILSTSNINDSLKALANSFIGDEPNLDLQDLYKCMILKDLKINIGAKGVNKIFPNLIPVFDVMLAESYFKQKEGFLNGKEFIVSTKLDGNRACIIKESNTIKIYSRQGKLIEGLLDIENEIAKIPDDIIFDGELLLKNTNNLPSDELFRATMKVVRKDGIKQNIEFHAFDIIGNIGAFKKGIYQVPCASRKRALKEFIKEYRFAHIIEVPILYQGKDENKILELLDKAKSDGQEGVMVNLSDGFYECKRSKTILKVKAMQTCDLKCVGFEVGKGANKNTLGAILVEYKGNVVGVGSGFSKLNRDEIWNNQADFINKIVEIQFFEESTNQKGGVSLRFPVFKIWRSDKIEPSYN